jgi:hypothetical protein
MKLKIAALTASLGILFSGGTASAASWGTIASPTAASWGTIASPTAAHLSSSPVIYVENDSSVVPAADLEAAIPAFQTAISRDFAPVWGTDATFTTDPAAAATADMVIQLDDYPDCTGCAGYHWLDGNRPISYIGTAFPDDSWQLTFTHEAEEMLADPWVNRFAFFRNRFYLVEVADPIESGACAYKVDGVDISDFITPAWYGAVRGKKVDFTRCIKRPGQIARHGYVSWKNPDGTWGQAFA